MLVVGPTTDTITRFADDRTTRFDDGTEGTLTVDARYEEGSTTTMTAPAWLDGARATA